jgi:ATP-dependent Zn protease
MISFLYYKFSSAEKWLLKRSDTILITTSAYVSELKALLSGRNKLEVILNSVNIEK